MQKITNTIIILFISIPILIFSYHIYKNWYYIEKYGFPVLPACVDLDEWYNRRIDNQVVIAKRPHRVEVRGDILILDNAKKISFYFLKKKDPASYINVGDTLNKEFNSLILRVKNNDRDSLINLRNLYYCEDYSPKEN